MIKFSESLQIEYANKGIIVQVTHSKGQFYNQSFKICSKKGLLIQGYLKPRISKMSAKLQIPQHFVNLYASMSILGSANFRAQEGCF